MSGSVRDACITGLGQSEGGRRLNRDPLGLTIDACLEAIEDAGLTREDIDGIATCWGRTEAALAPPPTEPLTQIDAGQGHSCGLDTEGPVRCWGASSPGTCSSASAGTALMTAYMRPADSQKSLAPTVKAWMTASPTSL